MKYPLYDYQDKVFKEVLELIKQGKRTILCQLPTRAGKSLIATALIEKYKAEEKRSWFIGHTNILIDQMSAELTIHNLRHGIISPNYGLTRWHIQVISKDTLFGRWAKMNQYGRWEAPHIIIVDETHLAGAGTRYHELLSVFPDSIIIGLTATPCRLDGKGLDDIYESMVIGPSIKELQLKERLCPIRTFRASFADLDDLKAGRNGEFSEADLEKKMDKPAILQDIVHHWETHAKGRKTLTFCVSVNHAHNLADQFNAAGYPSVAVSSKDKPEEIKRKLNAYYAGRYINLISVELFIMGFTVKDCDCIIQARPTNSLMIYMQTVGRGMVHLPGKTLINLDCVDNFERHGAPEADREWTLEGNGKKKKTESSKIKYCVSCIYPITKTSKFCPHCNFDFSLLKTTANSRIPEEKSGKMIEVA